MPPHTMPSNNARGEAIRNRRLELNLTIEEAAQKASVGTKTWARYESGAAIRQDKSRSVCKALKWANLPEDDELEKHLPSFESIKLDVHWPHWLEETNGMYAAASFVIGSEILLDNLEEDLNKLKSLPRDTHIGQLGTSWIADEMPQRFLTRYDYELIYEMKCTVNQMRATAKSNTHLIAHRVLDEIVLHLIVEESRFLMDEIARQYGLLEDEAFNKWDEWASDICGDNDVLTFLFSENFSCNEGDEYHFDRWLEKQFYCNR